MASTTLARLYAVQPSARASIKSAVGYAVFDNFSMKILVAGGGSGTGIAVNNLTKAENFMRMAEIQAGLGFGVKKFSLVWVFTSSVAFIDFVYSGWELGTAATAAAMINDNGASFEGAVAIAPGVWLYQLTDTGLALELTVKGTRYYRDSGLN